MIPHVPSGRTRARELLGIELPLIQAPVGSGDRPGEGEVIAQRRNREITRYSDDMPTADTEGDVEQLAMYAGQSAGLVATVEHAGLLVRQIAAEADAILAGLAGEGQG